MIFNRENFFNPSSIGRTLESGKNVEQKSAQEQFGGLQGYLQHEFKDAIWSEDIKPLHKSYEGRVRRVVNAIVLGEAQNIDRGKRREAESVARSSKTAEVTDTVIKKLVGNSETSDREYFRKLEYAAWRMALNGKEQIEEAESPFLQEVFRVALEDEVEILRAPKNQNDFRAALDRAADYAAQYRILFGPADSTQEQSDSELPLPSADYEYLKGLMREEIEQGLANRADVKPALDNKGMIQSNYDPNLLADYRVLNAQRLSFTEKGVEIIDRPLYIIQQEQEARQKAEKDKRADAYYASEREPEDGIDGY